MKPIHPILLGRGVLNWPRAERIGDRYGLVTLSPEAGGYNDLPAQATDCAFQPLDANLQAGKRGKIVAHVLATRQSGHIGDMFRGIGPETPEVGERIALGHGKLFYEDTGYEDAGRKQIGVGVEPVKPRNSDWMDPRKLYRCHDQTVELYFVPDRA